MEPVRVTVLDSRASITGARIDSVEFTGCELSSLRWAGGKISRARFDSCRMLGARFEGVTLQHAVFTGCKLDYATFGLLSRAQKPGLRLSSPGPAERMERMWHAVEAPA
jgi:uncharacterized protein YjbI with pentapeptide repeats